MLVLGVASLDANSGVALLDGNSIVAAMEEEKLNRSVAEESFPRLATFRCLRQHGAKILLPPEDFPYGERQAVVEDFAGRSWKFSQSIRDVRPEGWGGESGNLSMRG